MKGNHPKRRRDKYNPYKICEKDGHYYISFKDSQKMECEFEIPYHLYEAFNSFELEDLVYLNAWERHYEREEVWESTLNARAVHKPENLEDIVLKKIQIENLHSAIKQLPEIQQRRMEMYYFEDMTYEQIAKREMCSKVAIKYSVTRAIENLKKYFN
jgi:RNA polymerase sigma factor (sigma-70 family)